MKPIRNSAKAIIIENGQLLLTKNEDHIGYFYAFPGGGQEKFEELKDAVIRECSEEIGCQVSVKDIVYIREYIGRNHDFADWDHDVHQVEFYFECEIVNKADAFNPTNPDHTQIGIEWIDIDKLSEIRLYPQGLAEILRNKVTKPSYLGDIN